VQDSEQETLEHLFLNKHEHTLEYSWTVQDSERETLERLFLNKQNMSHFKKLLTTVSLSDS